MGFVVFMSATNGCLQIAYKCLPVHDCSHVIFLERLHTDFLQILTCILLTLNNFFQIFCADRLHNALNMLVDKIRTYKRLKRTLFIITKHNMRVFSVSPFFQATEQLLNGEKLYYDTYLLLLELFYCVVSVSGVRKNGHLTSFQTPDTKTTRHFSPFNCCLGVVLQLVKGAYPGKLACGVFAMTNIVLLSLLCVWVLSDRLKKKIRRADTLILKR